MVEKQQYTNLTNRSIGGQLSNVKNGIHILVHSNNWSKVANNFFALSDLLCFFYHVPNVSYLFFIFVDKNINHSMKRYLSVSIMKWKMNLSLQYSFWGLCILQEINMNIERKYGNCPWSKVFHLSTLRQCNIHLIEYVLYYANNIVFVFCIKSFSLKFWLCK